MKYEVRYYWRCDWESDTDNLEEKEYCSACCSKLGYCNKKSMMQGIGKHRKKTGHNNFYTWKEKKYFINK
jgi:hypothetical protein